MSRSALLELVERDRVIYLRVPRSVMPGEASARLAADLVDACAAVEEREALPVAVALVSDGTAFCLQSPVDAADCDAAGPAWARATAAIAHLSAPIVVAIGGDAIGPAWELALACDLRIAAAGVRLGSPELRYGRIPSAGGTQRLSRLVGPAEALRLLLLAEMLDAEGAREIGLLHRVAPAGGLEGCLEELLDALRGGAPIALAYAKEALHGAAELPLASGLRLEADLAALLQTTADRPEGIGAFLQQRVPRFQGS